MKLAIPAFPLDVINRALSREASLRTRLVAHAGKVFTLASGPLHARFVIEPDGTLAFPSADVPVALAMSVAPLDVAPLLAEPTQFAQRVHSDGDAELAATLAAVAQTLPWFIERTLASLFGPVAGQRLADAGREALALPGHAAERLRASVASYLRDESGLAVRSDEAATVAAASTELAARVEALVARVDTLEGAHTVRSAP